jgi:hypothetical membrane protein
MRVLYGLALFVGIAVVLVFAISAFGGVGSVELLVVIAVAAAISMLATTRLRRSTAPRS